MNKLLLVSILTPLALQMLVTTTFAQATDTITQEVRVVKRAANKPYGSSQITAFVEAYETKIEVLSLFKPEEIIMKSERSPEVSMERMVMKIKVKDANHPVLQYFAQKAPLHFNGQIYEHNKIPDINPAKVASVTFNNFNGTSYEGVLDNYLEVKLYGEEYMTHEKVIYKTDGPPKRIQYYDVDGTLMGAAEMRNLKLKAGTFTNHTVHGKEAVQRYGDKKYAEGVVIIRTK